MTRAFFENMSRPKAAAKRIATTTGRPLSLVQRSIARCSGYRDWHDLETSTGNMRGNGHPLSGCDVILDATKKLADDLSLASGEALYAISVSRLFGPSRTTIRQQLDLLVKLFRSRELPDAGPRQRGAVGKIRTPGRNGEVAILKNFGKPTHVITHQSGNAGVAQFEYLTPRDSVELFIPMRLYLAYGIWTESDGSHVLFSRDYCPMWRLRPGCAPERMDPWKRVNVMKQEFFWGDREKAAWPWRDGAMNEAEIDRLESYGVHYLPKLVDVLPIAIAADEKDFRDVVRELGRIHASPPAA